MLGSDSDAQEMRAVLAEAGRALEESSAVGSSTSHSSEGRENLREAERVQEELETRSSVSSPVNMDSTLDLSEAQARADISSVAPRKAEDDCGDDAPSDAASASSDGDTGAAQGVYTGGGGARPPPSGVRTIAERIGIKSMRDKTLDRKVEIALSGAKRLAIDKATNATGSGSGSASLSAGSSMVGSAAAGQTSETPSTTAPSISAAVASMAVSEPTSVLAPELAENLSFKHREAVDELLAKVVEKTASELAEKDLVLQEVRKREEIILKKKAELDVQVAGLRSKANVTGDIIGALETSKNQVAHLEDEHHALKSKLVGLKAELESKEERLEKEKKYLKDEKTSSENQLRRDAQIDKNDLKDALSFAAKEMEKAKQLQHQVTGERDMLHRSQVIIQRAHEAEIAALVAQLDAAKSEIYRRDKIIQEAGLSAEAVNEMQIQLDLESKLKEQSEVNKRVSNELTTLRIEMLQAHEDKEEELANLKAKVEVARLIPQVKLAANKNAPHRAQQKVPVSKLSSIEEEDYGESFSHAGSGISGQVSSGFGEGVGNLQDFDDWVPTPSKPDENAEDEIIENLRQQNASLHERVAELEWYYKQQNDEKVSKEAEHHDKIARLFQQVKDIRAEALEQELQALRAKQEAAEHGDHQEEKLAALRQTLRAQEASQTAEPDTKDQKRQDLENIVSCFAEEVEDLRQQLRMALESKRLLVARVEDLTHEIRSMEARHMRTVEDLNVQLRLLGDGVDDASLEENVVSRLQAAEEERNLLQNELDCERVHWDAKLESEFQNCTIAMNKLKDEETKSSKAKLRTDQLCEDLESKDRLLASSREALEEAESRAQDCELAASRSTGKAPTSLLSLLRCPARSSSQESSAPNSVPLQASIWEIVASMQEVSALICSEGSLRILDASRKAYSVWGSSALSGCSLLSLLYDQSASTWFQRQLESPATQSFATPLSNKTQGFWVKVLNYVEIRTRLGSSFDSTLICCRLPKEPEHGRPPVVMVIVEVVPAEQQSQRPRPSPNQGQEAGLGGRSRRRGPPSCSSSVASDDITANDSISNVNAKW